MLLAESVDDDYLTMILLFEPSDREVTFKSTPVSFSFGMAKRDEFQDLEQLEYMVVCRPGRLKTMSEDSILRQNERFKAGVRSKVERVFKRIKLDMGYAKTRYRGMAKNAHRINPQLAIANLFCFECWCRRCTA